MSFKMTVRRMAAKGRAGIVSFRRDGVYTKTILEPIQHLDPAVFTAGFVFRTGKEYASFMKALLRRAWAFLRKNRAAALFLLIYCALAQWLTGTVCVLNAAAGIPCPACGSTRAVLCLLRGELAASLRLQPLAVPLLVLGAFWLLRLLRGGQRTSKKPAAVSFGLLAVYLTVYAVRMLTLFPHTEPMVVNERALLWRVLEAIR